MNIEMTPESYPGPTWGKSAHCYTIVACHSCYPWMVYAGWLQWNQFLTASVNSTGKASGALLAVSDEAMF